MSEYVKKATELLDSTLDFNDCISLLNEKSSLVTSKLNTSKIVLCGLSEPAKRIIDKGLFGDRIECVIDKLCPGIFYKNIPVMSFDSIKDGNPGSVYIILTSVFLGDYVYELRKNKIYNIITYHTLTIANPEYDVFSPRYDRETTEASIKIITDNKEYYKQMLLDLCDEESKDLLGKMICYLLNNDIETLENIKSEKCVYFDPIITSALYDNSNAVLVDGGGFNGDTLNEFLSLNNKFKSYHLYEPDGSLLKDLKSQIQDSRINLHEQALYDDNTTCNFSPDSTGMGHIINNNSVRKDSQILDDFIIVPVVKLDDGVSDKINYIKLDVEGAEKRAIMGAKLHLSREKPILAVSVYHRADDIFELSKLIKSFNPDYKFYFRCSYNLFFNDMIMFCV